MTDCACVNRISTLLVSMKFLLHRWKKTPMVVCCCAICRSRRSKKRHWPTTRSNVMWQKPTTPFQRLRRINLHKLNAVLMWIVRRIRHHAMTTVFHNRLLPYWLSVLGLLTGRGVLSLRVLALHLERNQKHNRIWYCFFVVKNVVVFKICIAFGENVPMYILFYYGEDQAVVCSTYNLAVEKHDVLVPVTVSIFAILKSDHIAGCCHLANTTETNTSQECTNFITSWFIDVDFWPVSPKI